MDYPSRQELLERLYEEVVRWSEARAMSGGRSHPEDDEALERALSAITGGRVWTDWVRKLNQ